MKELIIGDLHFGIKSNSVEWLEAQCKLFENQIFKVIDENYFDRIVFLGDVFDIRYSLNQQVGIEVKKIIRKLSDVFNKKNPNGYIIMVAGNHDYYSPLEESKEYNSYQLLFGEEFLKCHQNIIIVDNDPLLKDDSLFLPWYWTENTEHFDELLYHYDFGIDVKAIYCHADLSVWPGPRIASLKGCPVYAGHIHYLIEDPICNLYNVGAALQLTFGDTNQERYLYIIEDFKIVDKIVNTTTPQFIRLVNEEIFDCDDSLFVNSNNIQCCIGKSNFETIEYKERLKYLKTSYPDVSIRIHIIEDDDSISDGEVKLSNVSFNTNIGDYIQSNIPEHLNDKFELIKNKVTIE